MSRRSGRKPNALVTASYLQYGCGWSAPSGWLNFDASPTLRLERIPLLGRLHIVNEERFPASVQVGDIVHGLPVPPSSFQGIYCSHVLEHLALEDCRAALRNTFRYLSPGGTFRLVVPDLRQIAREYVADPGPEAALRFMTAAGIGVVARPRSLSGRVRALLGNSAHLWMWDEASLRAELEAVGFVDVRRATMGDAEDQSFRAVERPDRFQAAVAMEARRPLAAEEVPEGPS